MSQEIFAPVRCSRCGTEPSAPRSTKLLGPFSVPSGVPKSSVHRSKKGYKTISHIKVQPRTIPYSTSEKKKTVLQVV
jgi:hypothetical protein